MNNGELANSTTFHLKQHAKYVQNRVIVAETRGYAWV